MAYYRLYFLNGGGHIEHFREFEAFTEADAIAQAEEWRAPNAMELWCGRQKVKNWEELGLSPEGSARSAIRTIRRAF